MNILISGGTGSLGQELVRQLVALPAPPKRIAIYSRSEHKQWGMANVFEGYPSLRFFIGDVRDQPRLEMALRDIDTVIHTAALKIVPTAEYNPQETIKTNIGGTMNVIDACIHKGVQRAILTSTDKAVNPVNLYGATKLAAEKLFVAANHLSGSPGGQGCAFSVVRYGNVTNSNGSVVPFWRDLAAKGEPLPITHSGMTRFWITLDQAADLVLSMTDVMKGGEIFIPRLPAFRIMDLADAIRLTSLNVRSELETVNIGIRPGEKIHETLVSPDDVAELDGDLFTIHPPWAISSKAGQAYSSDTAPKLTVGELRKRLA